MAVDETRVSIVLWLLLQLLSAVSVEGGYEMSVTVHSFLLLESRCALCYGRDSAQSCCDESGSGDSCPTSCDIKLSFCQIVEGLSPDESEEESVHPSMSAGCLNVYSEGFLGYNIPASQMRTYSDSGVFGDSSSGLVNPVTYQGTGGWEGAELTIVVYDRDYTGNADDVVDVYQIPVDLAPGRSTGTMMYTGRYGYTRLQLDMKVMCNGDNVMDLDENCFLNRCRLDMINCNEGDCVNEDGGGRCVCKSGFTGEFCTEVDECATNNCRNGVCVDEANGYRCDCLPGFTGTFCDTNIDDCAPDSCSGRGECVDAVQNFSCLCYPGYMGEWCEMAVASTNTPRPGSMAAVGIIAGGAVGGFMILLLLVIMLVLVCCVALRLRRTKSYSTSVQGNAYADMSGSPVPVLSGDDTHIYDVATCDRREEETGEYQTVRKFKNPIYVDDDNTAAVHEYETTDEAHSQTNTSLDQEGERKFVNPIYGSDNSGPSQGKVAQYDQVGNVYHTLESEQDRAERYVLIARALSSESDSASGDSTSNKEQTKQAHHSYEDIV